MKMTAEKVKKVKFIGIRKVASWTACPTKDKDTMGWKRY